MRDRALLPVLVLVAACGAGLTAGVPGPEAGVAGDVMPAPDRERLAALLAEREAAPADVGYRLGPDDLLELRIPDLLEVGGETVRGWRDPVAPLATAPVFVQGLRVSAAGDIVVPLVGAVRAAGRTPGELEEEIARRLLSGGILRAPQVSVAVVEYRSRVVGVVGSVGRPGLYPLTRPGVRLSELVWAAGGPTLEAGRVAEFVPAASAATPAPSPIRLDLEALLRGAKGVDPPAAPGDVVSVSPAGRVQVDGWVDKPGSYPVTRGLTVSGAVAAAGGRLFAGDERATLSRVVAPGGQHVARVDLAAIAQGRAADVPILDGDVIHLPAAPARLVPWTLWAATRELVHIGGSVLLF